MMNELLNKKKMKEAITRKGNLSASGLDKLTYIILKYEKDDAADLLFNIMNMMIKLQKCPEACKKGKVVMLPTFIFCRIFLQKNSNYSHIYFFSEFFTEKFQNQLTYQFLNPYRFIPSSSRPNSACGLT
jgi:hypothetical protein